MQKLELTPQKPLSVNIVCPDCGATNWLSTILANDTRLFHCQCGNWFCASPKRPVHAQKHMNAAKVAGLFWSRPLSKHKQAISEILQLISADSRDIYLVGKLDHLLVQKLADSIYENDLVKEETINRKQVLFSRKIDMDFAYVVTQFFSKQDREKHLLFQEKEKERGKEKKRNEQLDLEQSSYICPCCDCEDVRPQLANELSAIIFSCPVCGAKACLNITKDIFVSDYIFSMLASGLTKLLIPEDGGENAELLSELFEEDMGDIVAWARLVIEQALREELHLTASVDVFYLEMGMGEIYRQALCPETELPIGAKKQTFIGLLLSFFGIKEKCY